MVEIRSTSSCGIREIVGVQAYSKPEDVVRDVCIDYARGTSKFGMYYYSTNDGGEFGKLLASAIEDAGLGKVTHGPVTTNYNTGRKIAMFIWVPDFDAVRSDGLKFIKEKEKREAEIMAKIDAILGEDKKVTLDQEHKLMADESWRDGFDFVARGYPYATKHEVSRGDIYLKLFRSDGEGSSRTWFLRLDDIDVLIPYQEKPLKKVVRKVKKVIF